MEVVTLTAFNASYARKIFNPDDPELGVQIFNYDNSEADASTYGAGSNCVLLPSNEFSEWQVEGWKYNTPNEIKFQE